MSQEAPFLCPECAAIQLASSRQVHETLLRTYESTEALEAAAETGCGLCRLVQADHAFKHRRSTMRGPGHSAISVHHRLRKEDLDDCISWSCSTREGFSASSMTNDPAASLIPGRPVSGCTASDVAFDLAQHWLSDCLQHHEGCPPDVLVGLPTRLLDVGSASDSSPQTRLRISAPGEQGRYAALSYCWGTTPCPTLLTANIEDHCRCIDETTLTKTVRDAVLITRRLGLRYLWVDAQCIVQDSLSDWMAEAARMCDVYNKAHVTIQAAAARDGAEGCFVTMGAGDIDEAMARFPVTLEDGKDGVDKTIKGFAWVRRMRRPWSPLTEPIEGRGWTLQESLLSPRVLSFGSKDVSWQCRAAFCSESGRSAMPNLTFAGLPKPMWISHVPLDRLSEVLAADDEADEAIDGDTARPMSTQEAQEAHEARKQAMAWVLVVENYTDRQLTHSSDKLTALAGLAKYTAGTRQESDRYLAGLWQNDMPGCLLWSRNSVRETPRSAYRAPSWLWAAVDGPVLFSEEFLNSHRSSRKKKYSHVLDAVVEYGEHSHGSGASQVGAIVSGHLRLSAQLAEAHLFCDEEDMQRQAEDSDGKVLYLYRKPDAGMESSGPWEARSHPYTKHRSPLSLGLCQIDYPLSEQQANVPLSVLCLRIIRLEGLVLLRREDGCYVRIGTFVLDDDQAQWIDGAPEQAVTIV